MTLFRDESGPVVGVVMAGGLSRRMGGGDKCELVLAGKTLLQRVVERAQSQVDQLIINANGDLTRFADHELPVVPDCIDGYAGPLAGILTGMAWARDNMPDCQWVASFASDTPFYPLDLIARLGEKIQEDGADFACAKSDGQLHPVFGLWPVRLYENLYSALVEQDIRRMGAWINRHRCGEVSYGVEPVDPFFNINTPDDLVLAQSMV